MKLLILPGAGDPDNPLYSSVYRLLEREAPYDVVDSTLRWPGHNLQGVLALGGALDCARRKVSELEEAGQPYDFLARSVVRRRQSTKLCQSVRIKPAVPGAVHEVTAEAPAPVIEAYIEALFG